MSKLQRCRRLRPRNPAALALLRRFSLSKSFHALLLTVGLVLSLQATATAENALPASTPPPAPAAPSLWQPATVPAEATGKTLHAIFFLDDKHGWIVGDKGLCLATTDGGATWAVLNTGSDATLRCVRFNDANHGYICGDGDSAAPAATGHVVFGLRPMKSSSVLVTDDAGKTWRKSWVPCNFEVWCIETSAAPVLQVGVGCPDHLDGDITRSADDGKTWKERRVFRALSDIRAVDAKRWIAVGSRVSVGFTGPKIEDPNYLAQKCRALFSDDGGKTWAPSKGSDGSSVLRGLLIQPAADGKKALALAVGDHGHVLSSEDRGENWTALKSPFDTDLNSVAGGPDGSAIVAVGKHGRFILSADGGKTWRGSWVGQTQSLNGVAACGPVFWCVGENGTVLSCAAKTLNETKELAAAPELPKPVVKPVEPPKKATDAQRARVKLGEYLVYNLKVNVPAANLHTDCEVKRAVTGIAGEQYTISSEVLKGTPPPGIRPKFDEQMPIAELEDYAALAVGKSTEETSNGITFTTTREADETITVGDKPIACRVFKSTGDLPGNIHLMFKQWLGSADIPLTSLVKMELEQTMPTPGGGTEKITHTMDLLRWGQEAPGAKTDPPAADPSKRTVAPAFEVP